MRPACIRARIENVCPGVPLSGSFIRAEQTDHQQFEICLQLGSTWEVPLKGSFNLPLPMNGEKYRAFTLYIFLFFPVKRWMNGNWKINNSVSDVHYAPCYAWALHHLPCPEFIAALYFASGRLFNDGFTNQPNLI